MLDRNDYDLFIVSFPRARVCVARRRRVARAAAGRRLFSIFLQSEAEWNASRAGCRAWRDDNKDAARETSCLSTLQSSACHRK